MKKIINGVKYDTSKSTNLAYYSNGYDYKDIIYLREVLYRTANGKYFIHGESGPMGGYATTELNSRQRGEDIIPVDESYAMQWVEKNANECYEDIFGTLDF